MANGKRRHRVDQPAPPTHQQQQAEYEQQVIDPAPYVLRSQPAVLAHDLPGGGLGGHAEGGLGIAQQRLVVVAFPGFQRQQHRGTVLAEATHREFTPHQPALAPDPETADHAGPLRGGIRLSNALAVVGKHRRQGYLADALGGSLPHHLVLPRPYLEQPQQGGREAVGGGLARRQQYQQQAQPAGHRITS